MNRKLLSYALVIGAIGGLLSLRAARAVADAAPPFSQVTNIDTTTQPTSSMSGPALFAVISNTILFSAYTPQTGKELWRTDGTAAGTRLVKDINPGRDFGIGYYDTISFALNGALLFNADDGAVGTELWKSDGTATGTILLKDLWPGTDSGYAENFVAAGDRAFFTAQISETLYGLWITDGTPGGTTLLHAFIRINAPLVWTGNTLMFGAADNGSGFELWTSDGTSAGTTLVKDIYPGAAGSSPQDMFLFKSGLVLFTAADNASGRELWRSDGTPQGTLPIKDIRPGTLSSYPEDLTLLPGTLSGPALVLFSADDGTHGRELWSTDGTLTGTQLIKDVWPNNSSSNPVPLGPVPKRIAISPSHAFFAMNDGSHGNELWITDGTFTDTLLLADIYSGTTGSNPGNIVIAGGTAYFTAASAAAGRELWKTDGTPAGTLQVTDIFTGVLSSNPQGLTAFNSKLYFQADDGVHGRELWSSDGTPQGTVLVKDILPGANSGLDRILGVALDELYFIADDGVSSYELWKTDGTPAGTVLVKNIAPDVDGLLFISDFSDVAALGDKLMFGVQAFPPLDLAQTVSDLTSEVRNLPRTPEKNAAVNRSGFARRHRAPQANVPSSALWQSDGTPSGTLPIKTFQNPGDFYSPIDLRTLGDGVLFGASDNLAILELWRSDGTPTGTVILTDTVKPFFGHVQYLTRFGSLIAFSVITDTTSDLNDNHYSLWRTDGTPAGTQLIKANTIFGNAGIAVSGNTLFFGGYTAADDGDLELWKTDGTEAGTVRVKDIVSGTLGSDPRSITPGHLGEVFFIAYTGATGDQLWKSDGTEAGTVMVQDVRVNSAAPKYGELAYVNGMLFFAANDGVNGWELWKSDGTSAGTTLVADLYPGCGSSSPENLSRMNGLLYFSATGSDGRRTLWRSDGTALGTYPVRNDAGAPLNPDTYTLIQGQLMFSAADAVHGREVWRSDGTAAGTVLLQDIMPGIDSSNPHDFMATSRHVFLTAETPGLGRELWAMPDLSKIYLPLIRR